MGKKYIIELPESWVDKISDDSEWLKVPFTVADKKVAINTIIPLIPYTEVISEEAYQRGLNDAWEAAKKNYLPEEHGGLGYKTRMKVFDTDNIGWIFKNLSASEAIEKIRAYEEKKKAEDIKVGDEVMLQPDHEEKGICIRKEGNKTHVMWSDGSAGEWEERFFIKTGRHFPELAEILKKMGAE